METVRARSILIPLHFTSVNTRGRLEKDRFETYRVTTMFKKF